VEFVAILLKVEFVAGNCHKDMNYIPKHKLPTVKLHASERQETNQLLTTSCNEYLFFISGKE